MVAQTLGSIRIKPARLRAPRGGFTFEGKSYRGGSFLPEAARPGLEALAAVAARNSIADQPTVGILGSDYRLRSIPCSASVGSVAFELIPVGRAVQSYHLFLATGGELVCDCGDFTFRKAGTGVPCKHGRALLEVGLVAPASPRGLPPYAVPVPLAEPWPGGQEGGPDPGWGPEPFEPTAEEEAELAELLAREELQAGWAAEERADREERWHDAEIAEAGGWYRAELSRGGAL